jgi:hypothetical protein
MLHIKGRRKIKGVYEQDAEENIFWAYVGSNKTTSVV